MIELRPLRPPIYDDKNLREQIRRALIAEGKEQKRLLQVTTKTWKGAKPNFVSTVNMDPQQAYVITQPDDPNSEGGRKWWFLELGTRVRYAVMSRDFKAKTRRGVLGSSAGKGGMVFVSKKIRRPGIKARNWRLEVLKLRKKDFLDTMRRTLALKVKARPFLRELKR